MEYAGEYAGFASLDTSLIQYCKDIRVLLIPNGGSFASMYKLCTGDVQKAPKHNRNPWL